MLTSRITRSINLKCRPQRHHSRDVNATSSLRGAAPNLNQNLIVEPLKQHTKSQFILNDYRQSSPKQRETINKNLKSFTLRRNRLNSTLVLTHLKRSKQTTSNYVIIQLQPKQLSLESFAPRYQHTIYRYYSCYRVVDDNGKESFEYHHYIIKEGLITQIAYYIKHGLQT